MRTNAIPPLALAFVVTFFAALLQAQSGGYLQLGTIQDSANSYPCPMSAGWFQDAQGDMTCVDSLVLNCGVNNGNNTQNLGFTYGYRKPIVTQVGTMVSFSGGSGTMPADTPEQMSFAQDYLSAGYEIVQVKWVSDWEDTGSGTGTNIQYAACRPATFLKYVHDTSKLHSTGGMCAQGPSAGAGAIAYALAWYGAYN